MVQISTLKILGYGPWTLTLGSDREHELQMLQAAIYQKVQGLFSEKGCVVFQNRSDEFFVASDGLDLGGHAAIQQVLRSSFDVRLSVAIGHADTPLGASKAADEWTRGGRILDKEYDIFGAIDEEPVRPITIMHLDVDSLTARREVHSPYEISCQIFELYARMSRYFIKRESLAFFMGGDNFMVVASDEARRSAEDFIGIIREETGMALNCGIGRSPTPRKAASLATKSLDTIREIRDSGGKKPDVYEA